MRIKAPLYTDYPAGEPTTIAGAELPRVRVARTGWMRWFWRCEACAWVGVDLYSQQAALREACRHLKEGCPR